MPHADEDLDSCRIDEDGNLIFPCPTSPAETLGSDVLGVPAKGGGPWTAQAAASSSVVKPTLTRQRHRSQLPKQSFLDENLSQGLLDDFKDESVRPLQDSAPPHTTSFDHVEDLAQSIPVKGRAQKGAEMEEISPVPPRSGQNALLFMTNDGENQTHMSDDDKSPTPKPSRLISSRQRRMSDVSDMPRPSQSAKVTSSRQKEMSNTPTIEERPKKKGILQFSSAAPSVAHSIDEEPLHTISHNMGLKSSMAAETKKQSRSLVKRRQPVVNTKVRLSALDIDDGDEMDRRGDDPFDHANIPPSRGISPGPLRHKPKQATKKQKTAKSSRALPLTKQAAPRAKQANAKPNKSSPQERQPARQRQKAKPSAAESSQQPVAPNCGENDGDSGRIADKNDTSQAPQAKVTSTEAPGPALSRTTNRVRRNASVPQKDVIFISSAAESEDSDTDASDGDEYVNPSRDQVVQGNTRPPKTRTGATRAIVRTEVDTSLNKPSANGKRKKKESDHEVERADEEDLTLRISPRKSVKDVGQASVPEKNAAVKSQPKKKSNGTSAPSPAPIQTNSPQTREQDPRNPRSPEETEETGDVSSVTKQGARQVKRAKTGRSFMIRPQGASGDQKEPVATGFSPSDSQGLRAEVNRRSRADVSPDDLNFPNPNAEQSRTQTKHTESVMESLYKEAQDELDRCVGEFKSKERKANLITFGAERSKDTDKSRTKVDAANHQSDQQDSGNTRVTMGKYSSPKQINVEGEVPNDEKHTGAHDADDIANRQFGDEADDGPIEPLESERPEQLNGIEDLASVSQMRDSVIISNPDGQMSSRTGNKRKRPLPDDHTNQNVLPIKQELDLQSQVNSEVLECVHGSEPKVIQNHLNHQVTLSQKPIVELESPTEQQVVDAHATAPQHYITSGQSAAKENPSSIPENPFSPTTIQQSLMSHQPLTSQRVAKERLLMTVNQQNWEQRSTMSQQPMRIRDFFEDEQTEISNAKFQAPFRQETAFRQPPTLKHFSQPGTGKGSAKAYLQDLSKNLQKPSKRARLEISVSDVGSPESVPCNQFRIPAYGFSSDDIFVPKKVNEKREIDQDVVNQLRGIKSAKYPAAPRWETQKPRVGNIEKRDEPPRLRSNTQVPANASQTRFLNTCQSTSRDEGTEDAGGSDLWHRGFLHRHQGTAPVVKHTDQVAIEDPEPYEGVSDIMHRIVAGVLRALHSKESEVDQVVNNYRTKGGRIVKSIAATHANERRQLIEEHENRRHEYIRVCEDARHQFDSIGAGLQAIDFGKVPARSAENKTLQQLRHL
ncbi:hypothetical protein N0V93_003708 [Gnomoniopsis smithogilvyi]|uniref:Uncharacterized protein n=1 Tax=Gnomoniopsis smithogilvyi TaxID=1191159 RepID=A0A9W8Z1A5_9PEZI|nr:hypothetical protein N0V93_003708 [Gnomoniopsis smithogilvyi]